MTTGIAALWWSFLIAALVVTLVDVYLLARVVRLCRQIRTLTQFTLPAAEGIARNSDVGRDLGRTAQLIGTMAGKSSELENLTGAAAHALSEKTR